VQLIPIISDVQAPLHDQRSVDLVATLIADLGVDSVCVGDLTDQTQVSQWTRGYAGEFDGKLGPDRDKGVQIMNDLRIRDLSRSNHDDRLEKYVRKYSPAIAGLSELRTENFLRLDENGVRFHRQPYPLAPGWLLMHGDEGALSQTPGVTALGLAKKAYRSVACGHTHRQGLVHAHGSFRGKIFAPLFGLEVGHLMDMTKAHYLKGGIGNWQQGIGMLVVDNRDVIPFTVPIMGRKLFWDGKVYKN
jgi:hypothetical protein